MHKRLDLTGQKFGRLTVIRQAPNHVSKGGQTSTCWYCHCECGNDCIVATQSLRNGRTKSCGCYCSEVKSSKKLPDYTGHRFGRLTVIKRVEDKITPSGTPSAMMLCRCDCGNEKVIAFASLRSGKTKSCGCLNKENASKRRIMNTYDLSGEYGIGYTTKGHPFYFDKEDYDLIKDYCWNAKNDGHIYTVRNKKHIPMHVLIMNDVEKTNEQIFIDHEDGVPYNNRKYNLRPCTPAQNTHNRHFSPYNTSGVMGVWYDKSRNKWIASLREGNQYKLHKRFTDINDAIIARLKAEKEYFGDFAPQKYLFDKYSI